MNTHKQTNVASEQESTFSRFVVYLGEQRPNGKVEKAKTVGMAYLKDGQGTFTVRLWTFLNERFYLVPHKTEASKYYIMTRDLNRSQDAKNKYFWNIVGNAQVDIVNGHIRLELDLLSKPLFMNIFPETKSSSTTLAKPEFFIEAA